MTTSANLSVTMATMCLHGKNTRPKQLHRGHIPTFTCSETIYISYIIHCPYFGCCCCKFKNKNYPFNSNSNLPHTHTDTLTIKYHTNITCNYESEEIIIGN